LDSQRITASAFISVRESSSCVVCIGLFGMSGLSLSRAENLF
jgi:hypothetical protein